MGSLSTDTIEEFLAAIKQAGVVISNEAALRERMAEAYNWRYAFTTMVANGRPTGIRFENPSHHLDEERIHRTFEKFQFPQSSEAVLSATLKSAH